MTLVDSSRGPQNAEVSAQGRLDGLIFGLAAWQQSPVLGFGPASFAYSTGRGGQAHNLYGQVLSEMGLAGAVALLAMLVCFLCNWLETRRLGQQVCAAPPVDFPYHVSRAVFLNVGLLLLMGWAGHNLFRYNWQWFAAFQAIAVTCLRQRAAALAEAQLQGYADLPYPEMDLAPQPA